ncbi:Desosaminyl transferase EryCIII precursor [Clavibacter michiganensis]|uniref:Desosaminyl transferase EryCIII n=1 Tax=Clavibacter michiganensis TaxID=28447 RepID=A0A251YI00_9MICO|nr:glycosyltransferase [Clavibacter michiganensis]OUE23882.1 Desosaminyl transferase EryCIII precursor [Clavibacter michiganensis]
MTTATGAPRGARILFSFARGRGHLGPLLPIARAAAGHETALAGARSVVADQGGFDHVHPREVPTAPASSRGPGTGLLVPVSRDELLTDMVPYFLGATGRDARDAVLEIASAWSPDVVVCDGQDFGAMVAAERVGIPCVVVEVFATAPEAWIEQIREPMQGFRAEVGLTPDPGLRILDGQLAVVPFPASFRDLRRPGAATTRMRPDAPQPERDHPAVAWLAAGDEEHRVYATLGTVFNRASGDLLPRIIQALESLPVRALVTTGPDIDPAGFRVTSPRIRVERYVPQDGAIAAADLIVSHGGSGTMTQALSHGVPVLMLPLGADHLPNSERVRDLGAGAMVDARATAAELAARIRDLLGDPAPRAAAAAVAEEMRALPSPDDVMRRIEALLR